MVNKDVKACRQCYPSVSRGTVWTKGSLALLGEPGEGGAGDEFVSAVE